MTKLQSLLKDSYARALSVALTFTALAFALTGGALANAGETAQIAASTTVGTYSIAPTAINVVAPDGGGMSSVERIMTSEFRPRIAWEQGTYGFYSDFDNLMSDQIVKALNRSTAHSGAMSMGNFLSFTASDFVINSVEFDPLSEIGVTIDIIGDKIFTALTGGNSATGLVLISVAVVAVLLTALFQALRGQSGGVLARRTVGMIGVLSIFFMMGSAALSRDEEAEGLTSSVDYKSTPGTPLWAAQLVNDWLGKISATIADGFMGMYDTVNTAAAATNQQGVFGCSQYLAAMNQNFATQIETYAPSSSSVSITRVMDQMWVSTGLETWKDAQFGQNNPYGDKVWCDVLNVETHVPYPTLEANFAQMAANQGFDWEDYKPAQDSATNNGQAQESSSGLPGGNTYPTMAFTHPKGAENDVTHMGWAICRAVEKDGGWTWQLEDGWKNWKGSGDVALTDGNDLISRCDLWWRFRDDTMPSPDDSNYTKDAPNEFETSASSAMEHGAQAEDYVAVQDFVGHLSGASAGSAGAAVFGYAFGSLGTFIAFGAVALLVFVAKIFTIVFTITLWFVFLGALFSSQPFGGVIGKSFSKFLGVSLVASMVTAMMAMVVIITQVLMSIGVAIFGDGQLMTMIWAGVSPVMALIVLNMIFKKAFHVPSPLSISGARAWGQAGITGAAGVAAGAGITAGIGNAIKGMARTTGREMTKGAISKFSGGRLGGFRGSNTISGRRSAMDAEKLTPTGRESDRNKEILEGTRTRDEDGRLVAVSNAADHAGRKELRLNRSEDEAALRAQETAELRDIKGQYQAGGMSRAEVRANMKVARANVRAQQSDRAQELGLGIRERVRVRALRAQARPSEATRSALDAAAHRITQGGGTRGVDSRLTQFANTSVGARLTRSAHLRSAAVMQSGEGPRIPSWREQYGGASKEDRMRAHSEQRAAAARRADALSDAASSGLLDRAAQDGYGREASRDQAALRKLQRAQELADAKQVQADRQSARKAANQAIHATGDEATAAAAAYRRQREQLDRTLSRRRRRSLDSNARSELFDERMQQINPDKEG